MSKGQPEAQLNKPQIKATNSIFWAAGVSASVFASTLFPLLLYLKRYPRLAPLAVNAPDSFYYLTVARNSIHTSFYSFDGIHPTNGFHPVWQFLLYSAMKFNFLKADNTDLTLHRLFLGNLVFLSLACALLAWFCARHLRRKWIALPAVCPGFLWFAVALSAPVYLANWSYLNGMESSVELLFLGLALLILRTDRESGFRLPLGMFFFGLTVLSRLDDVFFLLPILVLVWSNRREDVSRRCIAGAVPIAMIAGYLIYNRVTVGIWMPTSGAAKEGLAIWSNLSYIARIVLPKHWDQSGGFSWFSEIYMRVFQMLVPMIVCGIFLFRRRRFPLGIVEALCFGVLLKGLYDLFCVGLFQQGSWYFAASIFVANLAIALWLDRLASSLQPTIWNVRGLRPLLAVVAGFLMISVSFNIYINHVIAGSAAIWKQNILDRGEYLRAMVQREHADRFIEMNDGILAYATGMPTLSGQGLVLDPLAASARDRGHFFDIALQRHFTLLMASGLYTEIIDDTLAAQRATSVRCLEFQRTSSTIST